MNICIFDTETTSLNKPFCYNIGYCIVNTDSWEILLKHDYVVEQIWHNLPLFSTSYYAEKRPLYVKSMRKKETILEKFGYITQTMIREFKFYNIEYAYAYNSSFDERVFEFNCDWFKCINPFDNVTILDIRNFAINFLVDSSYKEFCEKNNLFTDSGNYSTTAENMYRYITGMIDFVEAHTALNDACIETEILETCENAGADITKTMDCPRSISREIEKGLIIKKQNKIIFQTTFNKIRINKQKTEITLS